MLEPIQRLTFFDKPKARDRHFHCVVVVVVDIVFVDVWDYMNICTVELLDLINWK